MYNTACTSCDGNGTITQQCISCTGQGQINMMVKEQISIPKGVEQGVNLRLSKKGNYYIRGEPGDLLIKLNIRPHPYFKREGVDIHTDKYISITQAILGSTTKIETIVGKKEIKIHPGTVHGHTLKLDGLGVNKLPPN